MCAQQFCEAGNWVWKVWKRVPLLLFLDSQTFLTQLTLFTLQVREFKSTQWDLAACCWRLSFRLKFEGLPLVSCSGCESSALVQKDIQAETPWQFVPPPSSFNTFINLALIGRSFQWMWGCSGEIIIYRSNSFFLLPLPTDECGALWRWEESDCGYKVDSLVL